MKNVLIVLAWVAVITLIAIELGARWKLRNYL